MESMEMATWYPPLPPVVSLYPCTLDIQRRDDRTLWLLRFLGNISTFWIWTKENQADSEDIARWMTWAGHANWNRTRQIRMFTWDKRDWTPDKRDRVIWAGRHTSWKNPLLGQQVFALLPGIERCAYVPRAGVSSIVGSDAVRHVNEPDAWLEIPGVEMHLGLTPSEYREALRPAKVGLITSRDETYGSAYLEQWQEGVVPVVRRAPWVASFLPGDWPYIFESPVEAAGMVEDAIVNYPERAASLREWLDRRFAEPFNGGELMAEVWRAYILELGDRLRQTVNRGARGSR